MSEELAEVDFQRFWRRLQQLGLNAYESRSYLVLLGHHKFKALELAARSHVPRQKIYEVLDSLVEKGFAQVVQEKTKLFSAVEPSLAIPGYLGRKRQILEQDLTDSGRAGGALIEDLKSLYSEGRGGRGTLDFLRIVSEPTQTAAEYRRMLAEVKREYVEFSDLKISSRSIPRDAGDGARSIFCASFPSPPRRPRNTGACWPKSNASTWNFRARRTPSIPSTTTW